MQTQLKPLTLNFKQSILNSLCHLHTQKAEIGFGDHAKALLKLSLRDVSRGGFSNFLIKKLE